MTDDDNTPIALSREDLYELVWSKPIRELAKDFGISDVALAKRCRRLGIPAPGRGYWARIDAGQQPYRPKLPKREADAAGMYSNVGNDMQVKDTVGQTFLRGHQVTDQNGNVEFETIVPGWELVSMIEPVHVGPRTPHIHVKVFYERQIATTQLFLPDDLMDQLFADVEPYRSHRMMTAPALDKSYERIRNADDVVFNTFHGQPLTLQRTGSGIVAKASIAMGTDGDRGLQSYFR